jgi:hypothetical protein
MRGSAGRSARDRRDGRHAPPNSVVRHKDVQDARAQSHGSPVSLPRICSSTSFASTDSVVAAAALFGLRVPKRLPE